MAKKEADNDYQIAIWLDSETLKRLAALGKKLERPGLPVTRTGALSGGSGRGVGSS
jgi:hypothetical protein